MRDQTYITDLRNQNSKELKDLFIGIRVNTVKLEHETNPIIREKICNKLSTLYRLVPLKEERDRELTEELREFEMEKRQECELDDMPKFEGSLRDLLNNQQ